MEVLRSTKYCHIASTFCNESEHSDHHESTAGLHVNSTMHVDGKHECTCFADICIFFLFCGGSVSIVRWICFFLNMMMSTKEISDFM